MMISDTTAQVACISGAIPVRLRAYDHNGQSSALASPAGTNGHLLNRQASWLATYACSLGLHPSMRFFTTYMIDAGDNRSQQACFEFEFRWVGRIAIAIHSSRTIQPANLRQILGGEIDILAKETIAA
jgi:hypothetical protein